MTNTKPDRLIAAPGSVGPWSVQSAANTGATPMRVPADAQRPKRYRRRRSGARVLADKLADALDRWPNEWSDQERDEISRLRHHLEAIAEAAGDHDF